MSFRNRIFEEEKTRGRRKKQGNNKKDSIFHFFFFLSHRKYTNISLRSILRHTKLRSFLICLYFCLHSSKFEEMLWTPGFSIKKVLFRRFVFCKKLKRGNNRELQKTFGNIMHNMEVNRQSSWCQCRTLQRVR